MKIKLTPNTQTAFDQIHQSIHNETEDDLHYLIENLENLLSQAYKISNLKNEQDSGFYNQMI